MQGRATRGSIKVGARTWLNCQDSRGSLPDLLSVPSLVTPGEPRRQLELRVALYYLSCVR